MKPGSSLVAVFATIATTLTYIPAALVAVEPGQSREQAIAELGQPEGSATMGEHETLFYPQGTVNLRAGRVSAIDLLSKEELAARHASVAAAIARDETAREHRQALLEAEGRAAYARKKSSPAFLMLSTAEQLAHWNAFAAAYPMISIEAEVGPLRKQLESEQRARDLAIAEQQAHAEMEARLDAVEQQAARAERNSRGGSYYGPYFGYGYGVSYGGHHNAGFRPGHGMHPRIIRGQKSANNIPPVSHRGEAMGAYEAVRRYHYSQASQ